MTNDDRDLIAAALEDAGNAIATAGRTLMRFAEMIDPPTNEGEQ